MCGKCIEIFESENFTNQRMDPHLALPITRLDDGHHPIAEKIQRVKQELDEAKEVVRNNIQLVLQRDERLDALNARADVMEAGAAQFTLNAARLHRNIWWKNFRMIIALIAACMLIIIGAVLLIFDTADKHTT
uniref:V-SNARE coiled-coil homology domain-containing protein n=2 Tax=Ascaris TaxID=6251 RepID=A0A0M3I738_ASCLU